MALYCLQLQISNYFFVARMTSCLDYILVYCCLLVFSVIFVVAQIYSFVWSINFYPTQVTVTQHETQLAELKANISKSSVLKSWFSCTRHSLKLLHNTKFSHTSRTRMECSERSQAAYLLVILPGFFRHVFSLVSISANINLISQLQNLIAASSC